MPLVVQAIGDGGDAPDDFTVAFGEEVFCLAVLEEGILGAVQQLADLRAKRRDPGRVPPVQSVRQVNEAGEVGWGGDAPDERGGQMTPSSLPMRPKASSAKSIWSAVWVAMTLVRRRHCDGGTAGGTTGLVNTPAS